MKHPISIELLKQMMSCDLEAGALTWLHRPRSHFKTDWVYIAWNKRFEGKPALCTLDSKGYFVGKIFEKNYKAHRVVFVFANGRWPSEFLDHENKNRSDNRPSNLRESNPTTNQQNKQLLRANKSGFCGVYWHKTRKRWIASISVNDKEIYLGLSKDFEEAKRFREEANVRYGFHPNHGN